MIKTAYLAGGCFWCTEAIFKRVEGVVNVESGYTGGDLEGPTYQEISTGTTGHAETIKLEFDADKISFEEILDIFFATHNPTTKDRQGADVGTQYRSAIFYVDDEQKKIAEEKINELNKSEKYKNSIVTELEEFDIFFPAEDYHQNFYENNKNYPYCQAVIDPKIKKYFG